MPSSTLRVAESGLGMRDHNPHPARTFRRRGRTRSGRGAARTAFPRRTVGTSVGKDLW